MTQKCPECGSIDVRKAGIFYGREKKQRWQCKKCGRIFLKLLKARTRSAGKGVRSDKK